MKLKLSMAKYQQNKLKTLFLREDEYLSSEKGGGGGESEFCPKSNCTIIRYTENLITG